jgi:hypothetical protein
MKTIRRLYFYAVTIVSLEVVLWGLIGLLRSIFSQRLIADRAQILAQALALVLVGIPIFLIHWLWTQRAAERDEEERTAGSRAVFLYAALFATLVPAVHNLLAVVNRSLLTTSSMHPERALFGPLQSGTDNLVAILMNLLMGAYFWSVLRREWREVTDKANLEDVRRLYRHVWVLYGLLMVIFGSQQILRYMFNMPSEAIGSLGRETFVNGSVLLLVGTPIWYFAWRSCQSAMQSPSEQESILRLGVLYLLSLAGVFTVLTAGGGLVFTLLRRLFGEAATASRFISQLGSYLSVLIPLGTVWAYYGSWLRHEIGRDAQVQRRAGKSRLYFYLLSLAGLTASVLGLSALVRLIILLALGMEPLGADVLRRQLAGGLAALLVAVPLWLLTWRPMQAEALADNEAGDDARRSVLRKVYLYLVLFAAVIGGMATAVSLVFELLRSALTGEASASFLPDVLNKLQLLALLSVVLLYHLSALRRDGAAAASSLLARQADFQVLALHADGAAGDIEAAFRRYAPSLPLKIIRPTALKKSDAKARLIIIPERLATHPAPHLASWLRSFRGRTVVVPDDSEDVRWARDAGQAAQMARILAEGQPIRTRTTRGAATWMIVTYVCAALFGLQVLFFLLALAISAISRF